MDPLSITASCAGVLKTVATLTLSVTQFVNDVRESRTEMRAVVGELSDLSFCVDSLQKDFSQTSISCPEDLRKHLLVVLKSCDSVMADMQTLLQKLSSGNLGRKMQWAISGQTEMHKLRDQLVAHKSTIEIALMIFTMSLLSTVKQDVSDVKDDTNVIKEDTAHIPRIRDKIEQVQEDIADLKVHVLQSGVVRPAHGIILQRFLDSSTEYAESMVHDDDLRTDQWSPKEMIEEHMGSSVETLPLTQPEAESIRQNELSQPEVSILKKDDHRASDVTGAQVSHASDIDTSLEISSATQHPNGSLAEHNLQTAENSILGHEGFQPDDAAVIPSMASSHPSQPSKIPPWTFDISVLDETEQEPKSGDTASSSKSPDSQASRLDPKYKRRSSSQAEQQNGARYPDVFAEDFPGTVSVSQAITPEAPVGVVNKMPAAEATRKLQMLFVERDYIQSVSSDQIQFLLDRGADINNDANTLPLTQVVRYGTPEQVWYLLSHGAKISLGDPLSDACIYQKGRHALRVVQALVEHGADVRNDVQLLINAIQFSTLEVVKFLLDNGADPFAKATVAYLPYNWLGSRLWKRGNALDAAQNRQSDTREDKEKVISLVKKAQKRIREGS